MQRPLGKDGVWLSCKKSQKLVSGPRFSRREGKRNGRPSRESICVWNSFHAEFQMGSTKIWRLELEPETKSSLG